MSLIVWTNNASSVMASGISNVATAVTVSAGQGALFPSPSAGQYAMVTLEDVAGVIEVVKCTSRSSDTLTIVRAQEGTAGVAFASGSRVELRVTAGVLAALLQKTGDTLADTTLSGIMTLGGGGSIRSGEYAGGAVRGTPGDTTNQLIVPAGGGNPYIGAVSTNAILTKANLTANLPAGTALVVTGCIFFWFGSVASIPAGYVLCDGTASTPNLLDKIVMCGGTAGTYPAGTTGGSATTGVANGAAATTGTYALTVADLPAHHHNMKHFSFGVQGGGSLITGQPLGSGALNGNTDDTGGGGAHSHTIGSISHSHTCLPPYRALVPIMKS